MRNISKKVSITITDNGSNFLKAFRVFEPTTNEQELSENSEDCEKDFCEEDDSFVYIDIDEILLSHFWATHLEDIENESDLSEDININEDQGYGIKLPPHMRCPCHILNLIATTDVHKIENVLFKRTKKIVYSKLKKIWNKQARSAQASDYIKDKLDILFILHNATRWNSYYDAMKGINHLIATKNSELSDVFKHFKVIPLTNREEEFIAEFLRIMDPFTQALDVLQNEEKMNIGCVLPTINFLKKNNEYVFQWEYHYPLQAFDAVLNGIEKRFSHMMQDNKLKITAMSDPNF